MTVTVRTGRHALVVKSGQRTVGIVAVIALLGTFVWSVALGTPDELPQRALGVPLVHHLEPALAAFGAVVFVGVVLHRLLRGDPVDKVSPKGDIEFGETTKPVRELKDALDADIREVSDRLRHVEVRTERLEEGVAKLRKGN